MGKLTLAISYILPLILVIWLWINLKSKGKLQTLALLVLPAAYIAHWLILENLEGWPTEQSLPEEFQLLAGHIIEPDSQRNLDGRIDLWIKQGPEAPPRAYSLPYERSLHEKLYASLEQLKSGKKQNGYTRGRETGDKKSNRANSPSLIFDTPPPRHLPLKP